MNRRSFIGRLLITPVIVRTVWKDMMKPELPIHWNKYTQEELKSTSSDSSSNSSSSFSCSSHSCTWKQGCHTCPTWKEHQGPRWGR